MYRVSCVDGAIPLLRKADLLFELVTAFSMLPFLFFKAWTPPDSTDAMRSSSSYTPFAESPRATHYLTAASHTHTPDSSLRVKTGGRFGRDHGAHARHQRVEANGGHRPLCRRLRRRA